MNKTKISEIEKLRAKKVFLNEELEINAKILDQDMEYIRKNMGGIIIGTLFNGIVAKFPNTLGLLLPSHTDSSPGKKGLPRGNHSELIKKATKYLVIEGALDLLPLLIRGSKPMLIGFALNKIKNLFSRKRKKQDSNK